MNRRSKLLELNFSSSKEAYHDTWIFDHINHLKISFMLLYFPADIPQEFVDSVEVDAEIKIKKDKYGKKNIYITARSNKQISADLYLFIQESDTEKFSDNYLITENNVVIRPTDKLRIKNKEEFNYHDCRWKLEQLEKKIENINKAPCEEIQSTPEEEIKENNLLILELWENINKDKNLNLNNMIQNPLVHFNNVLKKFKKGKWEIEIVKNGFYLKSNFACSDRELIGIFEINEKVSLKLNSLEDGSYMKTKTSSTSDESIIKQYREIENNIIDHFRNK